MKGVIDLHPVHIVQWWVTLSIARVFQASNNGVKQIHWNFQPVLS
jgi:hypothetical protein